MNEWLRHLTFGNGLKALALFVAWAIGILFVLSVILTMFGVYG